MSDVAELAKRLDALEQQFATAQRERDQYRSLYLEMMERCRKLERGLLASKSEHLSKDDSQLSLDVLAMMITSDASRRDASRFRTIFPASTSKCCRPKSSARVSMLSSASAKR